VTARVSGWGGSPAGHLLRASGRDGSRLNWGSAMQVLKFVYWEDEGMWIGYLQEYPDYWTQGETLDDLKEHLKDLYHDMASGQVPGIRRVADLVVL
jgi:hypothetical protein